MIAVVFGTAFGGKWFEYVFSKFGVGVLGEVRWLSVGVHRHRRGVQKRVWVWSKALSKPYPTPRLGISAPQAVSKIFGCGWGPTPIYPGW